MRAREGEPASLLAPAAAAEDCSLLRSLFIGTALLFLALHGPSSAPAEARPSLRPAALTTCADCASRAASRAFLLGSAPSPYTSFTCTGGAQAFEKPWHVFTTHYPPPDSPIYRMCLVRDVCVVGGVPTFYVDPVEEARTPPPLRAEALSLFRGPYEASLVQPGAPAIVRGPIPAHLPYAPRDRLWSLTTLNNAQNYAHVLLDTILPAFALADFFGVAVEDVQHALLTNCNTFANAHWVSKGSGASFSAQCWANFEKWYGLLLPHAPRDAGAAGGDACYGAAVLGEAGPFSIALFGGHFSRAAAARAMRRRALAAVGLPAHGAPPPARHRLLVLRISAAGGAPALPELCARVRAGAGGRDVACATPGELGVREQLEALAAATVVVCEHGSTSYAALFMPPGASIVAVVPAAAPDAKEGMVLLFLPDVNAFYLPQERFERDAELAGALELAVKRAGERMGVPDK
jgi:hypothetical protein